MSTIGSSACPHCSAIRNFLMDGDLWAAGSGSNGTPVRMRHRMPRSGDITVCSACGELSAFTGEGVQRRIATPEETTSAMDDAGLRAVVFQVRLLIRK